MDCSSAALATSRNGDLYELQSWIILDNSYCCQVVCQCPQVEDGDEVALLADVSI